jgi:hypothetical protein
MPPGVRSTPGSWVECRPSQTGAGSVRRFRPRWWEHTFLRSEYEIRVSLWSESVFYVELRASRLRGLPTPGGPRRETIFAALCNGADGVEHYLYALRQQDLALPRMQIRRVRHQLSAGEPGSIIR